MDTSDLQQVEILRSQIQNYCYYLVLAFLDFRKLKISLTRE